MTRKDTILIAVVINAGLLAILFTTAVIYDTENELEHKEFEASVIESKPIEIASSPTLIAAAATTGDEVDNVLKYYSQPQTQNISIDIQTEAPEPIAVQSNEIDDQDQEVVISTKEPYLEVKVKKGDMLEKIARANKTTVGAIKSINHLQNERLSIGQVLKIPIKQDLPGAVASSMKNQESKHEVKTEIKSETKPEQKKEAESQAVYYVIKSGDSPWKVAKQFNVKFEDILRLNHLDEEKARNLKIGDRIRVK